MFVYLPIFKDYVPGVGSRGTHKDEGIVANGASYTLPRGQAQQPQAQQQQQQQQ